MKKFFFASAFLIIVSLTGCAAVPEYKQVSNDTNGAYIVPKINTLKLLSSAATVDVVSGPAVCGEKFPDPKRIFRLTQGNPLISSLNSDGAWIQSGMPINMVVMVLVDGFNCGQALAFLPEQGAKYRLDINGKSASSRNIPPTCEVLISKIDSDGKDLGPAQGVKPLVCIDKSQVK